jgi:hypothetical protein
MPQPIWITPAGSLGTIPEGVFYQVPVQAVAGDQDVFYRVIAGELPTGVQVSANGVVEGVPKNIVSVQGVPQELNRDITSRFAIRAFTKKLVNNQYVIDRLADRTFEITVTGQDVPEFVTPVGSIGTFFDGTKASIQIEFTDGDFEDDVRVRLVTGELPPGLTVDTNGLISGIILPLEPPPSDATPGFDATPKDIYPKDFTLASESRNFQFTLEITDGKDSNLRTFEIFVWAKKTMTADNTYATADNTFITADTTNLWLPILLNDPGFIGTFKADNFFAYRFEAIDFNDDEVEFEISTGSGFGFDSAFIPGPQYVVDPGQSPLIYSTRDPATDAFNGTDDSFDAENVGFDRGSFSLPPGLTLDPDTGWFYGYLPPQGATDITYRFAVRVRKKFFPTYISEFYYFTINITGNIETEVIWLTDPDLGAINNGAISTLEVEAFNVGGRPLQYQLVSGSNSRLPQGLTLQPSGNITGRVSFNTFALDGGTTYFDRDIRTRSITQETTFDSQYQFTVNAFAAQSEQLSYEVASITIISGGSGYTSAPTVTISAPPNTIDAVQATTGAITITAGAVTVIPVGNPGRGYISVPTVTITGGGGSGAVAVAVIREIEQNNSVSVFRTFTLTVNREYNTPYENLYIQCMPPEQDRGIIDQLVQNQDIIPVNLVYRQDDPNFGVAQRVTYTHAFGLTAASLPDYVSSLDLNHYWKDLVLGSVRTAQARDSAGNIIYEVVYSAVIDDLVNASGQSVGKEVTLAYPVTDPLDGSTEITTVYPNSLINMRDQVIDTVGQTSPALPAWMTSKQDDGRVLGFTPAWVIAYVQPGQSARVAYNIRTKFGENLNVIDFEVDRYILDRSQTHNWDPDTGNWIPQPPAATIFDQNTTVFDGTATEFIAPADRWIATNEFDKYLVFPKRTIIG